MFAASGVIMMRLRHLTVAGRFCVPPPWCRRLDHRWPMQRPHAFCTSTTTSTASPPVAADRVAVTTLAEHLQQSFDVDVAAGKVVPVFKKALLYGARPAIKDDTGTYTYVQLYMAAKTLSFQVSNLCGKVIAVSDCAKYS